MGITHILLAVLLASLASIIIQACDGHSSSACASAVQQFEAQPTDVTAQQARQACHMQ